MDFRVDGVRGAYEIYKTSKTNNIAKLSKADEKKDAVVFSSQAKDYQVAFQALKEVPDIRENKITEVLEKIESGSFQLSSTDIAGKLLGLF